VCHSDRVADLSVQVEWHGGRAVLSVAGELDLATAPDLRSEATVLLGAPDCGGLDLDLAALTFLDSSGIGALLEIRAAAQSRSVDVRVVDVAPGPARILQIAGLSETFGLAVDEAR
jgi:anti-sigma B factor antagonist